MKPHPLKYLKIALPVPLDRLFEYLPPLDMESDQLSLLEPGVQISVPFGRQKLLGVLIESSASTEIASNKLRNADSIISFEPTINQELMSLCAWVADYYHHPLGEVIAATIPPKLRNAKGANLNQEQNKHFAYRHTREGLGLNAEALKRSPKQQEVHQHLLLHSTLKKSALKFIDLSKTAIKALVEKKLIEEFELEAPSASLIPSDADKSNPDENSDRESNTYEESTLLNEAPQTLNQEQLHAFKQLSYHNFRCYLLNGVTGSGKTEIYLQWVSRCLQAGKQALILIPEIGLTPQTILRFKKRFNVEIAELHSNVSEGKRVKHWQAAKSGLARIIIGTRLAALSPVADLGLIIVDEEHDTSYKQHEGLRYSARDLSIYRAQSLKIPIILGSATPSLESLRNALNNKYQHLSLNHRATEATPPILQSVDVRNEALRGGLCNESLEAIKASVKRGEQSLVFVNRRGFASIVQCHSCGWIAECRSCDHRLTLHIQPYGLHCHQCDRQYSAPRECPNCHARELQSAGLGTEQTEKVLNELIPNTRVIRIDRDSTRKKEALPSALKEINEGEPCILVGTQMLAKGHHFPKLALVIVVDADHGLMSSDFRGPERMGQQIIQVAGRAGRQSIRGNVLIQTHNPEHPMLQQLLVEGYESFAKLLLSQRETSAQPPFSHLAIFRADSIDAQSAITLLETIKNVCAQQTEFAHMNILGPIPEINERVNNRYRFQLRVSCMNRQRLKSAIKYTCKSLRDKPPKSNARWIIDIDPVSD